MNNYDSFGTIIPILSQFQRTFSKAPVLHYIFQHGINCATDIFLRGIDCFVNNF